MPRPKPIPLRETPDAAPPSAHVIDVEFSIVGGKKKRSILGWIRWWIVALAIALCVGATIPPILILANRVF